MKTKQPFSALSRRSVLQGAVGLSTAALLGDPFRMAPIAAALAAGNPQIEAVKLRPEDLDLSPPRFKQSGPAFLDEAWVWGFPPPIVEGSAPLHYIRTFKAKSLESLSIEQMSDSPTHQHRSLHCGEEYVGPAEYKRVEGDPEGLSQDPFTFEIVSPASPKALYRFSSKHTRVIDGPLDVTYTHMPYAMVVYPSGALRVPYIHQHSLIKGKYAGKPVSYVGAWDRSFSNIVQGLDKRRFAGMSFAGVHSDGTREWGHAASLGDAGVCMYCKDGEDPVVSSKVEFIPTWERFPDDPNKTMVLTKAIFRFGGKQINYQAKWGWRLGNCKPGSPAYPGITETSGPWYESSSSRDFVHSMVYAENIFAFEGRV